MITISMSPNTEADDVWLAFKLLFSPLRWFDEKPRNELQDKFNSYFGNELNVNLVGSGRAASYLILKSLGIGKGDEVLVQAFNCVAVPNSVAWTGAKPVYVDIDESFNMDPKDLKKKITKHTKAIIVQHTFGIPAEISEITKIAKANNIPLIEDCAHALGLTIEGKKAGTFGDYAFFSFGRDKVISSVFGGAIIAKQNQELVNELEKLKEPKFGWQIKQLLHPILFNVLILPTYSFGVGRVTIGKLLLVGFQKLGLLSFPVSAKDKVGRVDLSLVTRMPSVLAPLAVKQFGKLTRLNDHRKELATYYFSKLNSKYKLPPKLRSAIWLRFPVLVEKPTEIVTKLKRKGFLLGRWYRGVLEPARELSLFYYQKGSCPNAQDFSAKVLNLPTHIRLSKAKQKQLINILNAI